MFENLIGQDNIRRQLQDSSLKGSLPHGLLFCGESCSGRMTAALELARVLSCTGGQADWDCPCRSCQDHRLLISPELLLLGRRSFIEEIKASGDLLVRTRAVFAAYMFIRNVRKLLKRFEGLLWEDNEKKLSKYSASIAFLTENLDHLDPGGILMPQDEMEHWLDEILSHVRRILPALPASIPVNQIRSISRWARQTGSGRAKVVILEGVETLQDSSANALLKILEEPPAPVTFILTAERKGAVLGTIRSRVRIFDFLPRSMETSGEILEKLYRYEGAEISLNHFFQGWSDRDQHFINTQVRLFLDNCFSEGENQGLEDLFQYFGKTKNREDFRVFLSLLSEEPRQRFLEDPDLLATVQGQALVSDIQKEINQSAAGALVYNQSLPFLFENLFYSVKEQYETFCTKGYSGSSPA